MKSYEQVMLESLYKSMYQSPSLAYRKEFDEKEISKLIEQDLKTIEELVEEGFFGDIIDKAKKGASSLAQKAKGAMSNIKQGVTQTIAKKLIDSLMSRLGDQDKAKFFGMIAGGEVDKKAVAELKQGVSNQQVQEAYFNHNLFEDDKTFFVENFFTKEILQEAIEKTNFLSTYNELLTEAANEQVPANAGQNRPLRKAMQYTNKLADEFAFNIASKLQELYGKNSSYGKDNKHIKNAIPKIMDSVNKRIDKQFKDNFGVSTLNNNASVEQPSNAENQVATDGTTPDQAGALADGNSPNASSSNEAEPAKKPGFIQRVLKFVSNPKVYITVGIAVAVVGFVAAVMGGAPVAAMLGIYAQKMAMGSGAKMLMGAITRKIKGQKVIDAKSIATDAGKGLLLGAFSAGLASIVSVVGNMMLGSGSVAAHPAQAPVEAAPQQAPPQAPEVPAVPSTPKLDANEVFKIATDSQFTGAEIDKPRMAVLQTLIDANSENNMGLSKGQIAKVFGDWSARAGAGAGITDPQKIINAINKTTNQEDLVNLMLKAAGKK